MKRIVVIMLLVAGTLSSATYTDLSKRTEKKVLKVLEKVWPGEVAMWKPVPGFSTSDDMTNLYKIEVSGDSKGFMAIANAPSRFDRFDYLLVVDNELSVVAVEILEYREDYGGEIASTRWLKQFKGKTADDQFKLNDDVVGISGATLSCRSASTHFKKILLHLNEMNRNGKL